MLVQSSTKCLATLHPPVYETAVNLQVVHVGSIANLKSLDSALERWPPLD